MRSTLPLALTALLAGGFSTSPMIEDAITAEEARAFAQYAGGRRRSRHGAHLGQFSKAVARRRKARKAAHAMRRIQRVKNPRFQR